MKKIFESKAITRQKEEKHVVLPYLHFLDPEETTLKLK
jgi:hypothetical protein